MDYLTAFLGGVAVSFSPCVYPLIPIILSVIGVKAATSRPRAFVLSLVFVTGLAVTYAILGLIASLTGRLFGEISTHPVSYFIIGNTCIIAGLSFFDIINLNFRGINLQNKVKKDSGYVSVFTLGLASGLVVGPCAAGALATILVYVGSRQNIFYGAALLLTFAYGVGSLLILAGTFAGLLFSLPKSGIWINRLKKAGGFILIGMGEYFLLKAGRFM